MIPGLYLGMSSADYHGDPLCAEGAMSLSSSGARTIINDCPAQFMHDRLHPKRKREFDIGTASHLLVLEPDLFEGQVAEIRGVTARGKPSEDYSTEDAKAQRDAAYAAGKTPLLPKEIALVRAMRAALFAHPIARHAFAGGQAEPSIFWQDREFGVWCRARPDYRPGKGGYTADFKTAASASRDDFQRSMANLAYHMQGAWLQDAEEFLTGERPERHAFVVQSKEPPHLVSVCWVDQEALTWGAIQNRAARARFAWCLERGEWPGYRPDPYGPPSAFTVGLPGWAVRDLERRHEAGEFTPPQEITENIVEAA